MEAQTSGERLKLLITDHLKMSQSEFARKIGIAVQSINAYTSNVRNLGQANIIKIINVFPEVNPEWLRSGTEPIFLELAKGSQTVYEEIQEIRDKIETLVEEIKVLRGVVKAQNSKETTLLNLLDKLYEENKNRGEEYFKKYFSTPKES